MPMVLRDLVLVAMLELPGSTTAAVALMNLSQSPLSRRYRSLAHDLGLERDTSREPGRRFADAGWMQLSRRGVNHHRLEAGLLHLECLDGVLFPSWPDPELLEEHGSGAMVPCALGEPSAP